MSQSTNDKAKKVEVRQDREVQNPEVRDREARDRAYAGHAYRIPDPGQMETSDKLSGLAWGSLPLKYIIFGRQKDTVEIQKHEERNRGARRE
jgi:hypothetical protein